MRRTRALQRNIVLYRLLLVFGPNGLMISVIYFFFTSVKGFDISQALFLIGFAGLSKALSEVPTGVVADKFSRKYSILIGYVVLLLCWFGILAVGDFWSIAFLMAGMGIGGSFISGADDALLYDSLKELNKSDEFKSTYNVSEGIELVAFAATILIGGILGNSNLYWPVITHIAFLFTSVIIAHSLTEPAITKEGEEIEHIGYLTHAKKSMQTIFSKTGLFSGLLSLFVSLALISAVFKSTKNILAPVLDQYGLSIAMIALIISAIIFMKAIGAFIASKVSKQGEEIREVFVSLGVCVAGLLVIVFVHVPLFQLLVFIVIIGLDNVVLTNLKTIVNDKIESSQRSTILSLLSLFSRSSEMLFLTSFGWIIHVHHFNFALLFAASWLSLAMFVLLGTQINRGK